MAIENGVATKRRKMRRLNTDKTTKLSRWLIENGHRCEALTMREASAEAQRDLAFDDMPEQSFKLVAQAIGSKFKKADREKTRAGGGELRRMVRRVAAAVQRLRELLGEEPDADLAGMLDRMEKAGNTAATDPGNERKGS